MFEKLPKAVQDKDLIKALVSSLVAAIIMSYVVSVSAPKVIHAVLGFVTVGLVLAAYLFAARAKVDRDWQAAAIMGFGVVSLVVFLAVSQLLSKH